MSGPEVFGKFGRFGREMRRYAVGNGDFQSEIPSKGRNKSQRDLLLYCGAGVLRFREMATLSPLSPIAQTLNPKPSKP